MLIMFLIYLFVMCLMFITFLILFACHVPNVPHNLDTCHVFHFLFVLCDLDSCHVLSSFIHHALNLFSCHVFGVHHVPNVLRIFGICCVLNVCLLVFSIHMFIVFLVVINISNTTTIVHLVFFPFYMFSITFVPTLVISWSFVGGRLLDACNFNKNFYTSNTYDAFPKLIHFFHFYLYFVFICWK
jgi:hypothetical protein